MRAVTAVAVLAMLLIAKPSQGQQCTFNGNTFTLPSFGVYTASNDQYQTYGQYIPSQPSLTGNRLWQMNLCATVANNPCQNNNIQPSYIYELNRADGSPGSCDMGLSQFGGWFQATAIDFLGNSVPSMNGTFMNAAQNRVAQVAIICGGTTDQLNPVNYPGANNGWYTYPNSDNTVWTWDVVFQYPVPGLCSGPQPPPATPQPTAVPGAPPTAVPPPSPPAPAGVCATADGAWFKLPSFNGTVAQSVPSVPGLSGRRSWQVSLCAPAAPTCSGSGGTAVESYVFEWNPMSNVCNMALNVQATNWTQVAGGLNALFTNLAGDRVANVTLSCGPTAALQALDTALGGGSAEKGWLTHRLPNSVAEVWVWDMWFATSALPGC